VKRVPLFVGAFGILVSVLILVMAHNAVDNSLTDEDVQFIPYYLENVSTSLRPSSYYAELKLISDIQRSVLRIAPGNEPLPHDQRRELKDLYLAKAGLCYDRSRVIEKVLRYAGFKTRHIAMYSTTETGSAIRALLVPGGDSHAITEVLTSKGWLIVDSNAPWLSIDSNNRPVSSKQLQSQIRSSSPMSWRTPPPTKIYSRPFIVVYGLYSRHGGFYPPYNFIPDINYPEFAENFVLSGSR